ncbi:MAG: SulP family inorganic anion transporter [Pseudomonadota bacterium]|nr:SulP family inorganic anion transporter [Pseudomonadota bacterium]
MNEKRSSVCVHPDRRPWLFASLRGFRPSWLSHDLIAGLLLTAIAVPEQLATARLAGLPPRAGLIAFVGGSVAFAVFGANRFLSAGADSTIAPIFAGGLAALAGAGAGDYARLAALLSLMVGGILIIAAVLRAGWIADMLSIPVTTGFLAGIGVHIIVGQLPAVLGVAEAPGSVLSRVSALLSALPETNPYPLAIATGVVAATLLAERMAPHIPGALLAVVASALAVAAFHLQQRGVAVLGPLSGTLPYPHLPAVRGGDAVRVLPLAAIVGMVCMMQTAVVLRAFPAEGGELEHISSNFGAIGAGCLLAGLLGSFAVNASPPRTAAVVEAGGRSQLASLTAVGCIAALILAGSALLAYVPLAALGGVLVTIAIRILRLREMARILREGGTEILLVAASAGLVIALPIETGMLCSIVLSLLQGLYFVARPLCSEFARVPGTSVWWPPNQGESGEQEPGVLVFAPAAPLNFTNAVFVCRRLQEAVARASTPVRLVVIEASGMTELDYTGSRILQQTVAGLRAQGIYVALARLSAERAQHQAATTGLLKALGGSRVFKSVDDAVRGWWAQQGSNLRPAD